MIFLRIGISIAILLFLFKQVDEKELVGFIRNSDKGLLWLAFIIFCLSYALCFMRWRMLLIAAGIHLSLKRVVISFCGGIFFNLVLPSTIGGDMIRSIDLAAHTKRPREVVATVLLDRLSGYVGLVALTVISLALGWKLVNEPTVLLSVAVIITILAVILVVLFNQFVYNKINKFLSKSSKSRIKEIIRNLHHEIYIFRNRKKTIVYNLLISFMVQTLTPLSFYFIAMALGIKINIMYFFVFLPIISAITMLPISIGGLGLRDAATIFFFAKAGVSNHLAFAMSLLSFSFIVICGAIGGLVYVLTVHHRRLQYNKPPVISTEPQK